MSGAKTTRLSCGDERNEGVAAAVCTPREAGTEEKRHSRIPGEEIARARATDGGAAAADERHREGKSEGEREGGETYSGTYTYTNATSPETAAAVSVVASAPAYYQLSKQVSPAFGSQLKKHCSAALHCTPWLSTVPGSCCASPYGRLAAHSPLGADPSPALALPSLSCHLCSHQCAGLLLPFL
jgi:hypothetical protein